MKRVVPDEWYGRKVTILSESFNCENVLSVCFKIPNGGIKRLADLTSQDMYKVFKSKSYDPGTLCKPKKYWSEKFSGIEIDFNGWITYVLNNMICPRKCLDFNWRIFHGQIATENKLKHMNFSTGLCTICTTCYENIH